MSGEKRFLVVEDDDDGGFLIERAVARRHPGAKVETFADGEAACTAARAGAWTAFIVHRALDVDGIEQVRRLRAIDGAIPIIMISGRDQAERAAAAGATHFVRYADWQELGGLL